MEPQGSAWLPVVADLHEAARLMSNGAANTGWPLMMVAKLRLNPDDFAPAARDFNPDPVRAAGDQSEERTSAEYPIWFIMSTSTIQNYSIGRGSSPARGHRPDLQVFAAILAGKTNQAEDKAAHIEWEPLNAATKFGMSRFASRTPGERRCGER
jgi:hypothetical protein